MLCSACQSRDHREFASEIAIHVEEGINGVANSQVLVFPKITICMNCGVMQGQIEEADLPLLGCPTRQGQGV